MTDAPAAPGFAGRPLLVKWLLVVLGCLALYGANQRELGLADTIPATLLPASILRDGDLVLDEFRPLFRERSPDGSSTLEKQLEYTRAIRPVGGKLRSSYPVGAAILSVPVYALPTALGMLVDFDDYRAAAKLSASLLTALSAGFVFLALRHFVAGSGLALLTAVYALGSSVWVVASQALWQHGPALFCLSLATWAALRVAERPSARDACVVSAAAAFAVVCRPQDAVGAACIAGYALYSRPRAWPFLALPGLVVCALLLAYNLSVFGTVTGGYAGLYDAPAHAFRHLDVDSVFTLPLGEGLAGLLVSPGKGLFVYSPVFALSLVALPLVALRPGQVLARALLVWVAVTLYALGKNRLWWGGTSYGPRYMTEFALPFTLALALAWKEIEGRAGLRAAAFALASYGVLVQALGSITWECGWHHSPGWIDYRLERLWDYRDPEILRCAEVLAEEGPRRPDIGPFARPRPPG
jgi:hypothetical protein